jgi:hypothetical protein
VKTVPGVASAAQDFGEKRRRLSQTRALTHPPLDLIALPARKITVLYLQRGHAQYFLTGYPL